MNVQLLLLLALVGPFCSFTHASPTADPTQFWVTQTVAYDVPDATKGSVEDLTVVTGPHPTDPPVAPNEDATEAVTEEATAPVPVGTEKAVVETETPAAAATAAPEPIFTDPPAVETAAPTEPAKTEVQPQVTAAATEKEQGGVLVEDGAEGGLGSGQVVGIVIGALLAVVIVIAVVIAAVRRMGKYSP